jgi:hypothetical protein
LNNENTNYAQEAIIRALIERVARASERCNHLESCVERIERKLDRFGEKIDERFAEIDRTLNGRLGFPGLVPRVALVTGGSTVGRLCCVLLSSSNATL